MFSYDEKPGIQAIANTLEDLSPDKKHNTFSRDYEYKRLGTVPLLAVIDLQEKNFRLSCKNKRRTCGAYI